MSSNELSSELQAVLIEASRAQHLEDECNAHAAIDCYYTATTRLTYLLDMSMDKGTALSELCSKLLEMYEDRITVLKTRAAAAEETQWVQLEPGSAANFHLDNASRASASFATANMAAACPAQQQSLQPGLQETLVAAGAAGLQNCYGSGTADTTQGDPNAAIELLRLCQRAVSGSLDDVVGLEEVKEEIEEAVFLPLQHPYLFKGLRQPAKTFLLHGPPGTGKTMLVEKVAAEAGFSLLSISPSMILSKWAGESEKAISQVFDLARTMQPAVLFLDEIDSLGQSRDSNTDAGARRLLTELLIQFNRVADDEGIYIFAATNRMQDCDPALLRRFSRRLEVPLPNQHERMCFFEAVLSRPEMEAELTSEEVLLLSQLTSRYSGSDLAAVCRLAAMAPVKELFQQQRRGHKRRRLGSAQGFEASLAEEQQQQQATGTATPGDVCGSCDAAGHDETAADTAAATGQDSTAGAGSNAAGSLKLQLRKLVLADFQAALQKVAPASADAERRR